jgi:hypothetical protein
MNLDFLLKYVFAGFLLIMLLSVAFFSDRDRQEQYFENNLLATTKQIELLNLQLNQAALKLQFGLNSEAEVTNYLEELSEHYQILSSNISTERKLYDAEMHKQLAALYSELYKKRTLVEDFKKNNAVLRTHLNNFQKIANDTISQDITDSATKIKTQQIQQIVLHSLLAPSTISLSAATNDLSHFDNEDTRRQKQLVSLIQQAKTIFSYQEKTILSLNIINTQKNSLVETISS